MTFRNATPQNPRHSTLSTRPTAVQSMSTDGLNGEFRLREGRGDTPELAVLGASTARCPD